MPQMMPLNWLSLMIMCITVLILFNTLVYFNYFPMKNKTNMFTYKKKINWKW